ncbi:hypothetical protein [Sulfitobacter pontiacus]|jgi:hypothetical protein|uniref:hypothetical protein n=1 Tax=Sulfitobacter pontiacus TaxID=60137 RepID=UPI000C4FBF56|nr:hypothetical protein [Sulfitobacter pontiacus]MAX75249.1 hypothetical protein [Roseobacter sp.]HAR81959.1 hypothetical protein [Sulfitobacter pontiacus]|tara:strand:+ start:6068 stop:6883 length:816 start_codon:yes stop_codon:yes gene_type:complete
MAHGLTLRELSETRNWIAFGKALSAAVDDPVRYGCDDASQLLAQVAQLRGVEPASLRNPLAAVNWMKENAPKALREENAKIPMTGVLTLSQISIVSKCLADELAPKFFSGGVSRRQLEIALRKAEAEQGRPIAGHKRMKRAVAFEEEVFRFLQEHPAVIELGHDVEIFRTERDALVPSDFTVVRAGATVAVVECKAHRSTLHRRYLLQTLAMAALRTSDHALSVLVVHSSWGRAIEELCDLCRELRIAGVCIAWFKPSDEGGPKLTFKKSC